MKVFLFVSSLFLLCFSWHCQQPQAAKEASTVELDTIQPNQPPPKLLIIGAPSPLGDAFATTLNTVTILPIDSIQNKERLLLNNYLDTLLKAYDLVLLDAQTANWKPHYLNTTMQLITHKGLPMVLQHIQEADLIQLTGASMETEIIFVQKKKNQANFKLIPLSPVGTATMTIFNEQQIAPQETIDTNQLKNLIQQLEQQSIEETALVETLFNLFKESRQPLKPNKIVDIVLPLIRDENK